MDKQVEEAVKRAQQGMAGEMERVYVDKLKPLQADMFGCSAKCYQDSKLSMEATSGCVNRCMQREGFLQKLISGETERMQQRFERCSTDCADKLRDRVQKPEDANKFSGEFSGCISKCADDFVGSLPAFGQRLRKQIDEIK